jgi:uncharacterized membrane protein
MKYLKTFLQNLLILILVIISMTIFAKIFYPETLSVFSAMGELYTALKLWPIIILVLLASALPRRRHN